MPTSFAQSRDLGAIHHSQEKEMATHSSVLSWRIPGTGEPGRLPSVGSHRVGHDWSDLAAAAASFPKKAPLLLGRWWEFSDDEGCRSGAPFTWTKSSGGRHPRSLLLSNFMNSGTNFHHFFQFPPLCWPQFWPSLFRISFAVSSPYCVLLPAFCMGAFWSMFCFQFKCHTSESDNHRNHLSLLFLVHQPMLIFSLHCPVRATRPTRP